MEKRIARLSLYVHPDFFRALNAYATRLGASQGEAVMALAASQLGLDPANLVIPRKKTGPKPGKRRRKP